MKEEQQIKQELEDITNNNIYQILELLKNHESDILTYLAKIVASLCDVDYDAIVGYKHQSYAVQSRWLFWYAYRYMTNEPYNKIVKRLGQYGHEYHQTAVNIGVNKMAQMIASDTIWKKRWIILKRVIKLYDDASNSQIPNFDGKAEIRIVIHKPQNVNVKIEYKEV